MQMENNIEIIMRYARDGIVVQADKITIGEDGTLEGIDLQCALSDQEFDLLRHYVGYPIKMIAVRSYSFSQGCDLIKWDAREPNGKTAAEVLAKLKEEDRNQDVELFGIPGSI